MNRQEMIHLFREQLFCNDNRIIGRIIRNRYTFNKFLLFLSQITRIRDFHCAVFIKID